MGKGVIVKGIFIFIETKRGEKENFFVKLFKRWGESRGVFSSFRRLIRVGEGPKKKIKPKGKEKTWQAAE